MKSKPMLKPMERPQYKQSLAMRLSQDRAEQAEPKLASLQVRPKDGWVYGKPKS